jgi:hypothetical protein
MSTNPASALRILERSRFAILLACLLLLFLIQPMLPAQANGEERIGADTALVAVLVACLSSLKRDRAVLLVGLVLIAGALAAFWIAHLSLTGPAVLVGLVAAIAAMSFAAGSLLWHVVQEREVRAETILGGICVYFLLGCVWAMIYSLIEQIQPGSLSGESGGLLRPEQSGTLLVPDLLYYSVFVLTTIGPQEVHPISRAARAWTGVEAMTGQLFLVIFISRMVGLHGASPRNGGGSKGSDGVR